MTKKESHLNFSNYTRFLAGYHIAPPQHLLGGIFSMAATSYAVFLFIIAALLAAITEAGVTVLSSSKLEKCALDGGGDTNQTLSCSEKLVVLLSITAEDVRPLAIHSLFR